MRKQTQINIIQSLRGISALGVFFAHIWHNSPNIVIHPFLNELSKGGAYGVQVFFIISGFILPYSLRNKSYQIKDFFRFMARRLVRLEPAYLMSILLVLLFGMVVAPMTEVSFSVPIKSSKDLWLHLLYLVPFFRGANWVQGVNWTLAIEFQYYIILGLLAPVLLEKSTRPFLKHIILIALSLSGFLITQQVFAPRWLTFFCMGITLYLFIYKHFTIRDVIIQVVIYFILNWIYFHSPLFLVLLILTPLLIYFLYDKKALPFLFLGKISYSIYLVHGVLGIYLVRLAAKLIQEPTTIQQILILIGILLINILASWLFYFAFEKPFQKLSKKISY